MNSTRAVEQLYLSEQGRIEVGGGPLPGSGAAGELHATVGTELVLTHSTIRSSVSNRAEAGGKIHLDTPLLKLDNGAVLSESNGSARAGDISLHVGRLEMTNASAISTDTQGADGGRIDIDSPGYLYLRDHSAITSSAKGNRGDGGDITLKPEFVVLDHSTIWAQTQEGRGGQVNITTRGVYNFSGGDIEKSINAKATGGGIDGIVEINAPETEDLEEALLVVPEFLSEMELMPSCMTKEGSSRFSLNTRGGLPDSPELLR